MKKPALLAVTLFLALSNLFAQQASSKFWQRISDAEVTGKGQRFTFPAAYSVYKLDVIALRSYLLGAPFENSQPARNNATLELEIPMPDGGFSRFNVVEYSMMQADLAAKFPEIHTYSGQGIDDPSATIRVDMTSLGFHAMILSPSGQIFIDPYSQDNTREYIIYDKKDLPRSGTFRCDVDDNITAETLLQQMPVQRGSGAQLRTYRLAVAATGEYTATKGGTVNGGMAGIVTTMNRVNLVYETEVAIRMVLVANNNLVVYTNGNTDPYTNNNGSTMLSQNATNLNAVIGSANYDIGHVFSTGGGGVATLNGPCGSNKARGVTGSSNPVGDAFDIDYVAHEMGHQFGGNHTFNSQTGNCGGGNRNASTAYEPGSGITIQGYAGICGSDNLAPNSIAYFHTISFDEIVIFSQTGNGNTCPVITNSGNAAPNVTTMGSAVSIPISTPFVLTGAATDANGDALTYCWEEFDLGPAGAWNVQSTTAPMFRTFPPTASPSRIFPKLSDIIANTTTIGELLPNQARTLKFRLTARDNRAGGGGVMHPDATLNISVVNNGGPFAVTAPNTAVTWAGNSSQTITWNVSGTTNTPINTSNVRISLSTDGGNSFPVELIASTPNDGSQVIAVPNINTSSARIKVEAVGNIFFDMSNINFTINAVTGLTSITTNEIVPATYCAGTQINVGFTVNAAANAGNIFTAQLSNTSGSFSNPLNIGTLTSTGSGTITGSIPQNQAPGSGYRIRVISSSPAVTGSDVGSLSILNAPTAATITANGATTFCAGGSVVLSGNNNGGSWSNGGSTASSITVSTGGDYFVTTTNACGSAISNHIIVTVNQLPSVSAGNVSGCQGTSIQLSGSPAGGTFSVPNPYTGPSTTYTYTFTNGNGCSQTSAPASITVNPLPVVNAGTYANVTTASGPVSLAGSPAGGTFSGTAVSGNTFSPAAAGAGTFTIMYTYTNGNGCMNSASTTITVTQATCNFSVGTISGPANPCPYMGPSDPDAVYSISATNASGYSWGVPANCMIVSGQGTNSIVVSYAPGFTSGYLNVTVGNACGGAAAIVKILIRTALPSAAGTITGPTNACMFIGTSDEATYTIRKVANAGSYQWTVPAGAAIVSHPGGTAANDTIITVTYNNNFVAGSVISVRPASFCGSSASERTLTITRTNPTTPAVISGTTDVCPFTGTGTEITYTTRKQLNASSFNWTVPANATIVARPGGVGTPNDTIILIVFNSSYTSGTISVVAVNGCQSSGARSLAVSAIVPGAPARLFGDPAGPQGPATPAPVDACPFIFTGTDAIYSINRVALSSGLGFATSYNWVLSDNVNAQIISHPAGSGMNDTVIRVRFSANYISGTVEVQAQRSCGGSSFRSLVVKKKVPETPSLIAGNPTPCPSSVENYSVSAANASNFNWVVPATMSIMSGQGTASIQVQILSNYNGGTIKVSTSSVCGTSAVRSLVTSRCPTFARLSPSPVTRIAKAIVFPNPARGIFKVNTSTLDWSGNVLVEILDQFGQIVFQNRVVVKNGVIDVALPNLLTDGFYVVRWQQNGLTQSAKVLIQK